MNRLLRDARFLLTGFLLIGAEAAVGASIIASVALVGCDDKLPRYLSFALQLVGFGLIAHDLVVRSREHGRPGYLGKFKAWWSRRPWIPNAASMNVTLGSDTVSAVGVTMRVKRAGQTLETRVDELEAQFDKFREQLTTLRADFDTQRRDFEQKVEAERQARQAAVSGLDDRLNDVAAGDIQIGWAGILLAVGGSLLSTAAPEIARLFGPPLEACLR